MRCLCGDKALVADVKKIYAEKDTANIEIYGKLLNNSEGS